MRVISQMCALLWAVFQSSYASSVLRRACCLEREDNISLFPRCPLSPQSRATCKTLTQATSATPSLSPSTPRRSTSTGATWRCAFVRAHVRGVVPFFYAYS